MQCLSRVVFLTPQKTPLKYKVTHHQDGVLWVCSFEKQQVARTLVNAWFSTPVFDITFYNCLLIFPTNYFYTTACGFTEPRDGQLKLAVGNTVFLLLIFFFSFFCTCKFWAICTHSVHTPCPVSLKFLFTD